MYFTLEFYALVALSLLIIFFSIGHGNDGDDVE